MIADALAVMNPDSIDDQEICDQIERAFRAYADQMGVRIMPDVIEYDR
jgi:hypothetical protein